MRKALIVGIDHYQHLTGLSGCVSDAYGVSQALERHADGTLNFPSPRLMVATGPGQTVGRKALKEAVRELFDDEAEIALFYFSGHGFVEDTGGFLCASDSEYGDDSLPLDQVMAMANASKARNKVIILDSCHSGAAGEQTNPGSPAEIKDGVTILAASKANQYALEENGSGIFTNLLIDALSGAAGNLVGAITPGSVYAHIDQSLGPWAQRPVFKTNVKTFISLRNTKPPIELVDLQALTKIFPSPDYDFPLDYTFEPTRSEAEKNDRLIPDPSPENTATFAVLQKYARVNLVRPVGEQHMFFAAQNNKSCELTVLGEHYWNLVKDGRI